MAEAWTVLRLLQWTTEHLKGKGIGNARRESEDLLGHVLELDRLKLYLQFETLPSPTELEAFRGLVRRRAAREPLQHLLGHEMFCGLRIKCDRRALVPRPETEGLVKAVIAEMGPGLQGAGVADLGTGSGCIALALLKAGAGNALAVDSSAEALELARENAESLGLAASLRLRQGDFLESLRGERFRLLVSNPPYIPLGEKARLQPEVRDHEPAAALFGGQDGREALRLLLAGAAAHLEDGGLLALECGMGQAGGLQEEFKGAWPRLWTLQDPFGIERFLMARK
jgi:release factor glutamine methyltransferase